MTGIRPSRIKVADTGLDELATPIRGKVLLPMLAACPSMHSGN